MTCSPNYCHIAVCPSPGIGHLTPHLRLASLLSTVSSIKVTLVIISPYLSTAEASETTAFLASHPHTNLSEFFTLPSDEDPSLSPDIDPFVRKYMAACRSAHRLGDHLSALSPPPNAVFSDFLLASGLNKHLRDHNVPNFNVITTSARFFSFMACTATKPAQTSDKGGMFDPLPEDIIPGGPILLNQGMMRIIGTNSRFLHYAKGIVINSLNFLEPTTIQALTSENKIEALRHIPALIFPIGPLHQNVPNEVDKNKVTNNAYSYISWLDQQPEKSVVFVSFGSRTPMSVEQMRELGDGLERSKVRFLWVIKTAVVDNEDKGEIRDLLGEGFLERNKEMGLVVKGWVLQEEILAHCSIGAFMTHCGWNSITEATMKGVPVLAWSRQNEQRVNAHVVKKSGLGIWDEGWGSGEELVKAGVIEQRVRELVTSDLIQDSAKRVADEAKKAWEVGGSSREMFNRLCAMCSKNMLR